MYHPHSIHLNKPFNSIICSCMRACVRACVIMATVRSESIVHIVAVPSVSHDDDIDQRHSPGGKTHINPAVTS